MKSIKHLGIATALAFVLSSSALAGDISGGKAAAKAPGDISGGKAAAKAPGDISGGKFADLPAEIIQLVLGVVFGG